MNKKAIYLPTNQNTVILNEFEGYYDIFLDGEYKTVPKNDVQLLHSKIKTSTLTELKHNIFLHCIKKPLTDILYSFNTNRLIPEAHQYKPLFKFLKSDNNRILIADEVGLGKTIEAGMIYKEIDKREDLKISLIVVPSSLTLKWREELKIRFNENFEIYKTNQFLSFIDDVENFGDSKLINEKIIISYHTLRDDKVMQKLANSFFEVDFLIMDEAHTMRNADTSTFKSSELITSLSKHIIFLTATPIQNYLQDLFNILYLLDNDYFRDFDYFKKMLKPNPLIHKLISLIRNNYNLDTIKQIILENKNSSYPNILQNLLNQLLQEEKLEPIKKYIILTNLPNLTI